MRRQIDPNLDSFENELFGDEPELNEKPEDNIKTPDGNDRQVTMSLDDVADRHSESAKMEISETPISENREHSSSSHHSSSHHSSSHHHHSSHHSSSHHSSSHHSGSSHHSSHHSHSSKSGKKNKKSLSTGKKILVAFIAIILAVILAIVGTFAGMRLKGKGDLSDVTKDEGFSETIEYGGHTYAYNEDVIAFAFMGVDKRELGLIDGKIGTAGQSDACIVGAVNTETGEISVIAIPRDTMVEVDRYTTSGILVGTEEMQLCLSYAYGDGYETSARNTMTSISRVLLNVPVEKYFALDLDGIKPINDSIGGVDIDNALYALPQYGIEVGDSIHLEGDMTEAYVRQRSMTDLNASLNRTDRQIQYLKAFAAQLAPAVMSDFGTIRRLYNTASAYSSTNVSLANATYLASLALSKGIGDFTTYKLEGEMKLSERVDEKGSRYGEFYPDEESVYNAVLSTFYTQID